MKQFVLLVLLVLFVAVFAHQQKSDKKTGKKPASSTGSLTQAILNKLSTKQLRSLYEKLKGKFVSKSKKASAAPKRPQTEKRRSKFQAESDAEANLCTSASLNVRSGACTDKSVVAVLPIGSAISQVGAPVSACGYDWIKITASNGVSGWVASKYTGVCSVAPTPVTPVSGDLAAKGAAVAQFAIQQVGKCYSQDQNLRRGPKCFDCSGLCNKAWEIQGKSIPWTTHGYPTSTAVVRVSENDIRPGDMLWRDGHIGIYVGHLGGSKGDVVHAAGTQWGVIYGKKSSFRYTAIYRPK